MRFEDGDNRTSPKVHGQSRLPQQHDAAVHHPPAIHQFAEVRVGCQKQYAGRIGIAEHQFVCRARGRLGDRDDVVTVEP